MFLDFVKKGVVCIQFLIILILMSFHISKVWNVDLLPLGVISKSFPPKGVSTLSWWWGLCNSVTRRAMPAVV
jgi:hypothetical protein